MLLSARWIGAQEAWRIGLVNRVVPKNKLLESAERMAQKIASYDPQAVRLAKQAVVRGLDLSIPEGLDLEKRLVARLGNSYHDSSFSDGPGDQGASLDILRR
jgi:enoyl-CoA hydratase/carnithine racemase